MPKKDGDPHVRHHVIEQVTLFNDSEREREYIKNHLSIDGRVRFFIAWHPGPARRRVACGRACVGRPWARGGWLARGGPAKLENTRKTLRKRKSALSISFDSPFHGDGRKVPAIYIIYRCSPYSD